MVKFDDIYTFLKLVKKKAKILFPNAFERRMNVNIFWIQAEILGSELVWHMCRKRWAGTLRVADPASFLAFPSSSCPGDQDAGCHY